MSRIGKLPIAIPEGVDVAIDGQNVTITGPKGTLTRTVVPSITVKVEDGHIVVTRPDDEAQNRAYHGLTRALLNNMVIGVHTGFTKNLEIIGVGYRAQMQGEKLVLNVGNSHPVEFAEPNGITFDVPTPNKIVVKGISKQQVGQIAADIRAVREPEPYKGKGIKYETEYVRRKEGKTGK